MPQIQIRERLQEAFRTESYHAVATGQTSHTATAIHGFAKFLDDLREEKTGEWRIASKQHKSQEPIIAQIQLIDYLRDCLYDLDSSVQFNDGEKK